ncbi:pilus assembly protein [Qipengyuania aquimaris]|uniref:TadE/TadG family type IV pilus assembly protein n=1 Tax=Qipengyuania aquimaris TaxID=255984 RepID=UPI001C937AE5|nr:TadE family protein [Qipengyuania aquimaris]MBY6128761.1 pilus assembly protein [Qipengyuania aquimaris]
MRGVLRSWCGLRRSEEGSVVIESAFVIPLLVLMALGGFEASRIVSRHNELQTAVAEAAAIVLANLPEEQSEYDQIELIIETSTGLPANKVLLTKKYRCNADASLVADVTSCATGAVISEIVQINLWDTYTPVWTSFGFGQDVEYKIFRRVQIS